MVVLCTVYVLMFIRAENAQTFVHGIQCVCMVMFPGKYSAQDLVHVMQCATGHVLKSYAQDRSH